MALPDYLIEPSREHRYNALKAQHAAPAGEDIALHLRILDKQQQLIPYVPNVIQSHYLAHRTGRDLILKPRQVGISTCIQADMFQSAITKTVMGATLAHDDETTQKLRRMAARFYDNLPAHLRPKRTLNNASTTGYSNTGSEITIATAGNTSGGRGGTYSRLHGSEVAYWKDAAELIAGIMQGIPLHGTIELESTGNGAQGWFYDECMAALKGKSKFKLHFYPWWWQPEYQIPLPPGEVLDYADDEQALVDRYNLTPEQINWRRFKQDELKDKFPQEYPEDPITCFLTSGSSVFSGFMNLLYTPPEQAAMDDHLYVMGIDWSGGGQGDADSHAWSIADATDYREVVIEATRQRDDDAVLEDIVEAAKRWRVITIMPELNSMGRTLAARLDKMLNERGYDWGKNKRGESLAPVVDGVFMTNPVKDELVKDMKAAFKAGYKLVDDTDATDELLSFVSKQLSSGLWTYGAKSQKHDDRVIARLLCHRACYANKGL